MRYLITLLLCLCCSTAWAFPPGFIGAVCSSGGAATCSASPYITQGTYDTGGRIGYDTATYAVGLHNTGTTDLRICAIELNLRENGALTGKTLYFEKWSTTPYNLSSKLADVHSIDATLLSATLGYYKITFPAEVTLSQNQSLVFTLNEVTGTTNYITIGVKGGGSTIADQAYVVYTSANTGTYNSGSVDLMTKIYRVE